MKRKRWEGTWPTVTRSRCCCSSCCYYSFLPLCRQEGRRVGARACPCVHQSPGSRAAEPAKPTCRPGGSGRRRACPGLGRDPRGGGPAGLPGPGWSRSQTLAPSWFSLAFPPQPGVALALPREQVAFAAWHLFLRAAASEVQTGDRPVCPPSPRMRPAGSPEGLAWACPGGGGHRGACPASQSPLLTLQVSHRRARTVLSSVCWGLVAGGPGGGGQEDME